MSAKTASLKAGLFACSVLGLLAACAVSGPGYDGYSNVDVGVGYVGGFYEPYGYDYGGWGGGGGRYRVGPPAGGGWHGGGGHGGGGGHPVGHPGGGGGHAPSIPSRPRGR